MNSQNIIFIDQRDIQRRGGVYAKYPVAAIVADFLKSIRAKRVLDVTYGEGRFYKVYRPELLVGADPNVWEWVVRPDIFIPYPVWSVSKVLERIGLREFDVIVCDPPWGERHRRRPQYNNLIAFATAETIIKYAFELAKYLKTPYLLLHYDKLYKCEGWTRVRTVEFRYVARYLNNPGLSRTTYFIMFKHMKE